MHQLGDMVLMRPVTGILGPVLALSLLRRILKGWEEFREEVQE